MSQEHSIITQEQQLGMEIEADETHSREEAKKTSQKKPKSSKPTKSKSGKPLRPNKFQQPKPSSKGSTGSIDDARSPKLYLEPARGYSIPVSPEDAILYNHPLEIKSIGGLMLELLQLFIQKYSNPLTEQSAANVLNEFRHHMGAAVVAYLRAASISTTLPIDVAEQLNIHSQSTIYVDSDAVKIVNAFMPVKDAVQLNVVDVLYKANVVYDQLRPIHDKVISGSPLSGQDAINYNNIMQLNSNNPIIKAIEDAHRDKSFATYMNISALQSSPYSRIGETFKYIQVQRVKVPTFIFDFNINYSKYKTRRLYNPMVRSKEYVTINNSKLQGIKTFTKLPQKEADTIIKVNSIYQYFQGYNLHEITTCGFNHIRYQDRDFSDPTTHQLSLSQSQYVAVTPKTNYEDVPVKTDSRITSQEIVYFSEADHGGSSNTWYKLAVAGSVLSQLMLDKTVHVNQSRCIQVIDPRFDISKSAAFTVLERYNGPPFGISLSDVSTLRANYSQ